MIDDDFDIHEERFSQGGEKDFENALRPLASLSTTPCCTVLQDWVRPRSQTLLPTNSVSASRLPRVPCSTSQVT